MSLSSSNSRPTGRRWRSQSAGAVALVWLWGGVVLFLWAIFLPADHERSREAVRAAMAEHRPDLYALAMSNLEYHGSEPIDIAMAGEAAASKSEHALAIELYRQLPQDGGRWECHASLGLARRFLTLGQATVAERHLRRCLELCPYHMEAGNRLGKLLQAEGRVWESAPHFFRQILRGKCRGDELAGMATVERFFRADDGLEQVEVLASADDPVMALPPARRALFQNETAEAERLLRRVIEARPELGEAQGRLGRIIVDRGDLREFLEWRGSLNAEARRHPEVFYAEGLKARQLGQTEGAIACFLDVLQISPNHLGANTQISSCLEALGYQDAAREFSVHAGLLADLEQTLNLLRADTDAALIRKVVKILSSLGRYWEAAGWCYVMTQLDIPQEGPRREMTEWLRLARQDEAPNARGLRPARLVRREDFSEPRWPAPTSVGVALSQDSAAGTEWKFVEQARELGIDFQYVEGTQEENRLQHIFNVMGGGLAAIDYDLDGWPDLYLAQANRWREELPQPENIDRLYQNRLGERFVDVTTDARLGDPSFSHGVTVGDFDQDGFPDVYIGNKGPNRLYRNNGDGTFVDTTDAAGVAGNEWTTSSVFADFNGDGLPDLYVLNYTLLAETAQKECRRPDGQQMACTPDLLLPETDRCYVNSGDGTFRDVSAESGVLIPDGRGLGVVAWDFSGDGRLGVFVANDTTANFLFTNTGNSPSGAPLFREEGVVRGVAYDVDGNAQASMGVAAGDPDGDGRIDLFVTNFFGDSDTLYSQRSDGFFEDLTRLRSLRDPGFWLLGFGCQFADFDGDGWEDIVVTNGHVDQRSSRGDPDRERPQFYRNEGGRRFVEVPPDRLGPFFEGSYLGRGLAILDWNRDGATDFAVSHLHGTFALVTNATGPAQSPLVVRLIGRSGCREPTGARVEIRTAGRTQTRLLTGGDGFLVTNERRLSFAVPAENRSVDVTVTWPGGKQETWQEVPAGSEVLLIEGRAGPLIQRRFQAEP